MATPMIVMLRHLWFCLVLDQHDWRWAHVYTHVRPPARIPSGREYRHQGDSTPPQELTMFICDRPRCHAIGWPIKALGSKTRQ